MTVRELIKLLENHPDLEILVDAGMSQYRRAEVVIDTAVFDSCGWYEDWGDPAPGEDGKRYPVVIIS